MYGLIGEKLNHSFSANFFNKKFEDEGIDETYHLFPLSGIDLLPKLIKDHTNLKGLNVTLPYKEAVIPFLSQLSPEAIEIGAVNVIKIERNDKKILLKGFNTDCIGFENSLRPLLHPNIKKALILGTGGASKAVAFVLRNLGIQPSFVSRNHNNETITYQNLNEEIIHDNLLIINTTPLGMYPVTENCPDIPYQHLTPEHICYDLIYNPEETQFMKRASRQGATIKNGLEMLERQALAAWEIWKEK